MLPARCGFLPTCVGSARRVARKQTNSTRRVWSSNRRLLAPCASVRRAPNALTPGSCLYPGELLNSAATPCLEMCSAIKHLHDSSCSPWLPWRQRASEADRAAWSESRRPRSDGQLLRALLADESEAPGPTSATGLNGPLESVLRRNLSLFATALAMTKITHLITIKRFTDKFISTAWRFR